MTYNTTICRLVTEPDMNGSAPNTVKQYNLDCGKWSPQVDCETLDINYEEWILSQHQWAAVYSMTPGMVPVGEI